jgi:hypothetical protein
MLRYCSAYIHKCIPSVRLPDLPAPGLTNRCPANHLHAGRVPFHLPFVAFRGLREAFNLLLVCRAQSGRSKLTGDTTRSLEKSHYIEGDGNVAGQD